MSKLVRSIGGGIRHMSSSSKDKSGITEGFPTAVKTSLKVVAVLPMAVVYGCESVVRRLTPARFRRRDITGKVALVTGAGSGIGRQLAVNLANKGAKVVVWGRTPSSLEETRRMIEKDGGQCSVYKVDVSNKDDIYSTADDMLKKFGKVDILVNNAGVVQGKHLLEADDSEIRNEFEVNAISHFFTTKAFLPGMVKENSGHIVTVASMAGYFGLNKLTSYCASKFAAVGYHEALTLELKANGHSGIATTLVGSHYINTGMFRGVRTTLLPIMSEEQVGQDMLDAILTREQYCIPWWGSAVLFSFSIMPEKLKYLVTKITGIDGAMNSFEGHTK